MRKQHSSYTPLHMVLLVFVAACAMVLDVGTSHLFKINSAMAESGIIRTQLAGNSLDDKPFFEYVKAFNENATVEVAIDPTRFPQIIGRTADIYLIKALYFKADDRDPVLEDVTVSGPQMVTFGDTIQQNTVQVAEPNELESKFFVNDTNEYTGLGRGYDIVIDMNQNGRLDAGDYVDGAAQEAGLYVIGDTAAPGPLTVTEENYRVDKKTAEKFEIPDGTKLAEGFTEEDYQDLIDFFPELAAEMKPDVTQQVLYFPTNIAMMAPLPLIVICHGAGHDYTWYDHIGNHMASYGYIVMSHENGADISSDRSFILEHIDALLEMEDTVADGALAGKIDTNRIILMGHSFGGHSVAAAYNTLVTKKYSTKQTKTVNGRDITTWVSKDYNSTHISPEDIKLVSSMAPAPGSIEMGSLPGNVNYHMWVGSGDTLVKNDPKDFKTQSYTLFERAEGWRMQTTIQGVGHAWFHNGTEINPHTEKPEPWFDGPCGLGKELTHKIQLGLLLPLIKHFAEDNIPATDFFWRPYERFHPIGVDLSNPCIVVTNEYRDNPKADGVLVIDDYQTNPDKKISSSGGEVTFSVQNVEEDKLQDSDKTFEWDSDHPDPFNGALQCDADGDSRGVVFGWNDDAFYEWEVVPGMSNFKGADYISFRGAQVTEHPKNKEVSGNLTFTLTLVDSDDHSSSINISAYGGGLKKPYQRSFVIPGEFDMDTFEQKEDTKVPGGFNEMERIRIRIADFQANGSDIDLSDIVAVRLDVGPSWGSPKGRIIIDELMLTPDIYELMVGPDNWDFENLFNSDNSAGNLNESNDNVDFSTLFDSVDDWLK